jgi:hypothetical protein
MGYVGGCINVVEGHGHGHGVLCYSFFNNVFCRGQVPRVYDLGFS